MADWQPSAALEVLRLRAELLARARHFFAQRRVLEVETPILSAGASPAPHLDSLSVEYQGPPELRRLYLHTSPEFPMKRLLAAGSGSIYQVCRVFRDGEAGARHNPEFTLLEWYRVGADLPQLVDEVETFVRSLLAGLRELPASQHYSYRELFRHYAGVDGLDAGIPELRDCLERHGFAVSDGLAGADLDVWRDLVLTHVIEPQLRGLVFVRDYPATQAALARILPTQPPVAARFECYLDGVELANGFHELADATEQRRRFEQENRARAVAGRPTMPVDERLLAALQAGLPDCSGVALGFDRLVMCAIGAKSIDEVMAFSTRHA